MPALPLTIENVKSVIEKLNPLDTDAYFNALSILKSINLPLFSVNIDAKNNNLIVFRSRAHEEDVLFKNLSDFYNPPSSYVHHFGRCNTPYQSRFYCSENRITSYMELLSYWAIRLKVGEKIHFTIGRWKLKTSFDTLIITTPDKEKRISAFDISHADAFDHYLSKLDNPTREACIELYRFLFETFRTSATENPLTYYITTAYTNLALSVPNLPVPSIYYPSVPFKEQGTNFAFNDEFIKNADLELSSVLRDTFEINLNAEGQKFFIQIDSRETGNIDITNKLIHW